MNSWIPIATTIVVAIATVILTWLTSKYVKLTKAMVGEMRSSREPAIFADFEVPGHEMRFIVGNSGPSAARNISFHIVQDIKGFSGGQKAKGLAAIPVIQSGIPYLSPGRTLKWIAGVYDFMNPPAGDVLHMKVSYENDAGRVFHREFSIDMSLYRDVLFESFRNPEQEVAQAIKETGRDRHGVWFPTAFAKIEIETKQCPMCAESIPIAARKCSHCGEFIDDKGGT